MRFFVAALLLVAAHFSLTALVPAPAGKAWIVWPFAADSIPVFRFLEDSLSDVFTPILSVIAGAGFIAALLCLFEVLISAEWWLPLVLISSVASVLLFILNFGLWALLPIAIDVLLLWGALSQMWSVGGLRGS